MRKGPTEVEGDFEVRAGKCWDAVCGVREGACERSKEVGDGTCVKAAIASAA